MRKYLLLAAVAGCLMNAEAMADESVNMNVSAKIQLTKSIEKEADLNFGTITILKYNEGACVVTLSEMGVSSEDESICTTVMETTSLGAVKGSIASVDDIVLPDSIKITKTEGNKMLDVDNFTKVYVTGSSTGKNEVDIGGKLTIPTDTTLVAGDYTGSMTVTVAH